MSSNHGSQKPETLAIHAGQHPDPATGARAVPAVYSVGWDFVPRIFVGRAVPAVFLHFTSLAHLLDVGFLLHCRLILRRCKGIIRHGKITL